MTTQTLFMEKGLWLTQEQILQIRQEAIAQDPLEVCGLVAGIANRSYKVYPITNELHSRVRFRMQPQEMINAFLEIEKQGWELLAIYHSHPQGPPSPSPTDLMEFAYPGTAYLICSPLAGEWICRAFLIQEGIVSNILLNIE
jgi:proteasome lid subunit RPN8/RPN11